MKVRSLNRKKIAGKCVLGGAAAVLALSGVALSGVEAPQANACGFDFGFGIQANFGFNGGCGGGYPDYGAPGPGIGGYPGFGYPGPGYGGYQQGGCGCGGGPYYGGGYGFNNPGIPGPY